MRLLKKGLLAISSCALITSSLYSADEFKALPIFTDSDWKANIEVAVVGGYANYNNSAVGNDPMYGLEISLDCPVFTLSGDNPLRQQFSYNKFNNRGVDITTIEINPYYFIDLTDNMVFGFGPGAGYAKVEANGRDTSFVTYQVGAGVKYYSRNIFAGADIRWQGSKDKDYFGAGMQQDLENTRVMLKVGYRF